MESPVGRRLPGDLGVGDNQEGLGSEGELVDAPQILEPLEEEGEEG